MHLFKPNAFTSILIFKMCAKTFWKWINYLKYVLLKIDKSSCIINVQIVFELLINFFLDVNLLDLMMKLHLNFIQIINFSDLFSAFCYKFFQAKYL